MEAIKNRSVALRDATTFLHNVTFRRKFAINNKVSRTNLFIDEKLEKGMPGQWAASF